MSSYDCCSLGKLIEESCCTNAPTFFKWLEKNNKNPDGKISYTAISMAFYQLSQQSTSSASAPKKIKKIKLSKLIEESRCIDAPTFSVWLEKNNKNLDGKISYTDISMAFRQLSLKSKGSASVSPSSSYAPIILYSEDNPVFKQILEFIKQQPIIQNYYLKVEDLLKDAANDFMNANISHLDMPADLFLLDLNERLQLSGIILLNLKFALIDGIKIIKQSHILN